MLPRRFVVALVVCALGASCSKPDEEVEAEAVAGALGEAQDRTVADGGESAPGVSGHDDDAGAAGRLTEVDGTFVAGDGSSGSTISVDAMNVYVEVDGERHLLFGPSTFERAGRVEHRDRPSALRRRGARVEADRGRGLIEWYEPRGRDLEQAWTLNAPLGDRRGGLTITVPLGPDVEVISSSEREVELLIAGVAVRYDGLRVTGADGATVPALISSGTEAVQIVVDDSSVRYPITIDPMISTTSTLLTGTTPLWGTAAAVDGTTIFIGQRDAASSATRKQGAVHQYAIDNLTGAVSFVRTIRISGTGASGFGATVDTHGG